MTTATIRTSRSRLAPAWPRRGKKRGSASAAPCRYVPVCPDEVPASVSRLSVFRHWVEQFLPGAKALLASRYEEVARKRTAIWDPDYTLEQLAWEFLTTLDVMHGHSSAGTGHQNCPHTQGLSPRSWRGVNMPLVSVGRQPPSVSENVEIDLVDEELGGGEMPARPTRPITMRFERVGRIPPRISEATEE